MRPDVGFAGIDLRQHRNAAARLWPVWVAIVVAVVTFLGRDPARLCAPLGPSHDGFNAAVYMNGGLALLSDPIDSRLGARVRTRFGDTMVYAHHPPLIYAEAAIAAAVAGPAELAARLPAVVSSMAVIALLSATLMALGFSPGAAATALLFAVLTPMFTMFGATTEPHVLGLAPMSALMLLWQRARSGRSVSAVAMALVAALAAFTSWQAALFAAMVGLTLLVVERQRSAAIALLAGTLTAAVVTGAWILWAYDGTTGDFVTRAIHRLGIEGSGRVSLRHAAGQQRLYLADLFPVGHWLIIPIAAIGLLNGRTRLPVGVALIAVIGYAVLFRNGASDHNYWLYCIILPLTLSVATAADALRRLAATVPVLRPALPVLLLSVIAASAVTSWSPSDEERQREWAASVGAQARAIEWPAKQRYALHMFGGQGKTELLPWLLYYSRRAPFGVDGPQSVAPDEIVLRADNANLMVVHGAGQLGAE